MRGDGNYTEVADESAVKVGEALGPLHHGFALSVIHQNSVHTDNIAQKGDTCLVELALGELGIELVINQALEDRTNILDMLLKGIRINQNVINVDNNSVM